MFLVSQWLGKWLSFTFLRALRVLRGFIVEISGFLVLGFYWGVQNISHQSLYTVRLKCFQIVE